MAVGAVPKTTLSNTLKNLSVKLSNQLNRFWANRLGWLYLNISKQMWLE